MSVKRYTLRSIYKALSSGQDLEMPDCDVIAETDYDALDAQFAELRQHLGTLTPGGSHTCITCAAHVKVITEDLEPRIRALEADLAAEKMQHSVTIAEEHESRSEFQDRIAALEAERDDVVEARGEMARENVRLATELAEWRELYEFGLKDRNELLDRAQTAEAYAARNALRVIALEAALRKHMDHHDGCESNDWSNESDWITTSFGFVLKSDECSCGANQLALELDPAAKAVVDGYASETKSAPGFCPECLMTGGHKLRCSKAETSDYGCTGCRSTPCICATLETKGEQGG